MLAVLHRVHLLFTVLFTDILVEGFLNSLYDLGVSKKVKRKKKCTARLDTVTV